MCHDDDVTVSLLARNQPVDGNVLAWRVIATFPCVVSVPAISKVHGAHLKASAAMVRLRLYDILALLPPKTYEGKSLQKPLPRMNE